jgi:hypothetical protein
MAQWMYKMDVKNEWKATKEGRMTIPQLSSIVLKKLKAFKIEGDYEIESIMEEFELLASNDEASIDNFDYIWEKLYDWADTPLDNQWNGKKNCWIEIF